MDVSIFTSYCLSPLGTIEIKATKDYIFSVLFVEKINGLHPNDLTEKASHQLEEYFLKKRVNFDLPIQQEGTEFQITVWDQIAKIPFGRTITYKELATRCGNPTSVRVVGSSCGKNSLLIILPCHRIIGSNGELTGYAGELWRKKWLLDFEIGDKNGKQGSLFPN